MFVPREATILHADLDAFFASVEQRDDVRLRSRPVIVGGGVVLAASYEARAFGVRSAMGGARARRLCPHAIVVAPRFAAYVEASKAVGAIFRDTAPVVEQVSIDEAFLDVRGLQAISGTPPQIATCLRVTVREQVGLALTVGVATTKLLAKVASGVAKPDGLLVVAPDEELAFLHPLPVGCLWGVGAVTAAKLHKRGIRTVADLASAGEAALVALLGPSSGRYLYGAAFNRDVRPVRAGRRRRSIGSQRALGRSAPSADELDAILVGLVDRVTRRMRRAGLAGRTIVLRLRFGDFTRASRSRTLPRATDASESVLFVLRVLLAAAAPLVRRRGVTLVGITISGLERGGLQLTLPLRGRDERAVDAALDDVRERFGTAAIGRAVLLGHEPALSAWLMPEDDP
ncbi:MAG: polymerase [Solirubrobacteraceae bacterium]|jgi:DNA polymerase-4|nr:polymerase [Solirubrobacteraceae bacterium]